MSPSPFAASAVTVSAEGSADSRSCSSPDTSAGYRTGAVRGKIPPCALPCGGRVLDDRGVSSVANTLTVGDSWRGKDSEDALQPFLCLVLECSQLSAPAARFPLTGTSEVRIGRGERGARRSEGSLSIRVADQWMSSKHVRIQESFGRWVAEDLGSKNGTALNGEATTRAVLRDGDFLTVGQILSGPGVTILPLSTAPWSPMPP